MEDTAHCDTQTVLKQYKVILVLNATLLFWDEPKQDILINVVRFDQVMLIQN